METLHIFNWGFLTECLSGCIQWFLQNSFRDFLWHSIMHFFQDFFFKTFAGFLPEDPSLNSREIPPGNSPKMSPVFPSRILRGILSEIAPGISSLIFPGFIGISFRTFRMIPYQISLGGPSTQHPASGILSGLFLDFLPWFLKVFILGFHCEFFPIFIYELFFKVFFFSGNHQRFLLRFRPWSLLDYYRTATVISPGFFLVFLPGFLQVLFTGYTKDSIQISIIDFSKVSFRDSSQNSFRDSWDYWNSVRFLHWFMTGEFPWNSSGIPSWTFHQRFL